MKFFFVAFSMQGKLIITNSSVQGLVEIDDVDTTAEVEEEADVKPSEQELCDNRLVRCMGMICRFDSALALLQVQDRPKLNTDALSQLRFDFFSR